MTRFGKTNGVRSLIPYATLLSVSLAATLRVEHSCSTTNPRAEQVLPVTGVAMTSGFRQTEIEIPRRHPRSNNTYSPAPRWDSRMTAKSSHTYQ